MMQALADHLKSIPGAYDAVSVVKVTGIDQFTSETLLPSSSGGAGLTNTVPVWQAAGYTPAKVVAGWQSFASAVNTAFPDKILGIAILNTKTAFPMIDNSGQQVTASSPSFVNVTQAIIASGLAMFPGRFMVQFNALNAGDMSPVVLAAANQGAIAGYQTNQFLKGATGDGTSWQTAVAPTAATYQALLDAGIEKGGARYLEVWASDVARFPTAIAEAQAAMLGRFYRVDGSSGTQTLLGTAMTNMLDVEHAAGTGTVLVDLKAGLVSRGSTVDAHVGGMQGVQLGADPAVVLGLTAGTDFFYGGTGPASFYNEGATDYIQGGSGSNAVVGGSGTSIFYGVGGADTMLGGAGGNFMQAGPTGGTDTFYGNGGQDFVYGGAGATVLYGGGGLEKLTGGTGYNELIGSTKSASVNIFNGGTGTDVFYAGIGTNLFYESTGTDVFAGNAGMDAIYGGAGRSFVYGGTGTDVITTGAGNQYVKAGSGKTYFNDTAANLTAGRFDQIDNFAGGQGTDLYLPTAVQGATSFVSQNGGTAVLTAVAGGTAAIFASNTDVATVRSHTHFTL